MTPYGEKAMVQELDALRAAGQGDRNNALNMAAYRLAQLLAKGHLDETHLLSELIGAASSIGLTEKEATQTIQSGIKKGRGIERGPDPGETYNAAPKLRPLATPHPKPNDWSPDPTGYAPSGVWQTKAAAMVAHTKNALLRSKDKVAYLASRGISEFTASAYNLGWFDGIDGKDLVRPRATWGLPPEQKEDGSEKKLWIPRGLVIPWIDIDGVHRIRIRRQQNDPRYYVLPGSAMGCLIYPKSSTHRAYMIVESELDALMLQEHASDMCGVVALGNSSRKPDKRVWTALSGAAKVLVSLDNDPAGEKASAWYLQRLRHARIYRPPLGKDPGEAYQQGVNIRDWVQAGLPPAWFH